MPGVSTLAVVLGGHFIAETAKLLISPDPVTGSALFGASVGKLCEHFPDWLKSVLGRPPGEPTHWFAVAFHAAFLKTMDDAAKGPPLKGFEKDHPGEWNTLHRPQILAMETWFRDLRSFTARPAVGTDPIVKVEDAFLKDLLEQSGPASDARDTLATALRASLTERLITKAAHLDSQAESACRVFIDWVCQHLNAQFQIHFLDQMHAAPDGKPSQAWVSYQYLTAQTLQQHGRLALGKLDEILILLQNPTPETATALETERRTLLVHWKTELTLGIRCIEDQLQTLAVENRHFHATTHTKLDDQFAQLARLEQVMADLARQQAGQGKSLADLSRQELEQELATRLKIPVTELETLLTHALASRNLTTQAIALLAETRFVEAESKSLEAARQKAAQLDDLTESIALDYYRAGLACYYRGDYRAVPSHFREAFTLATRLGFPQIWAMLQNDLGVACFALGLRVEPQEGNRLLREAVQAFQAALEMRTRGELPQDWAMTQSNMGNALREQGLRSEGAERVRLLREAVQAYRDALQVYTREAMPQDWAMTQNNLAAALSKQVGQREDEEEQRLMAEVVQAYRAALEVHTREAMPHQWAMTQNNLGTALRDYGSRSQGVTRVRLLWEAVQAYRSALQIYTREAMPQDWAMTQNNLGTALGAQGERSEGERGQRLLGGAVKAFRAALKVYTRDALPQDWAMTQNNLGCALSLQANRESGPTQRELWKAAEQAYRAALEIWTKDELPYYHQMASRNLKQMQGGLKQGT